MANDKTHPPADGQVPIDWDAEYKKAYWNACHKGSNGVPPREIARLEIAERRSATFRLIRGGDFDSCWRTDESKPAARKYDYFEKDNAFFRRKMPGRALGVDDVLVLMTGEWVPYEGDPIKRCSLGITSRKLICRKSIKTKNLMDLLPRALPAPMPRTYRGTCIIVTH